VISAIDSNVLLDILIPNDAFADAAAAAIEDAAAHGSLVVTDIVYAEICVQFPTHHDLRPFF
jgi:predicted nucleic acid-binding protein